MKKIFLVLMGFLLIAGFCCCSKKKQQQTAQPVLTAADANDANSVDPRLQRAREKTLSDTPGQKRPRQIPQ
jgi:ABC-type oligopeptide transport system substrate-binding subunit